jgi:hypothetical protein
LENRGWRSINSKRPCFPARPARISAIDGLFAAVYQLH